MGTLQNGPTPGGVRTNLAEVLPLKTPFMIQIFPVYGCNFRCGYCIYALDKSKHGYISDVTFMDIELYKKCIDDMKNFNRPLKMIRFAGIGEPLLHPRIDEMVAYSKQAGVAQSIDIVTNASLLTKSLSDALISAGLTKLRISLEGLSDQDYKRNSKATVNFENMVSQIRYFHEQAKETQVYIKIIDYMVQDLEDRQRFFELFSPICDQISVEHLTPTIKEIDYDTLSGGMKTDKPQNAERLLDSQICPEPFYMMQINADGKVVPCCSMEYPIVMGDTNKQNVERIWNGQNFNQFRLALLDGNQNASRVCEKCNLYIYGMYEEDVLDENAQHLKKLFQALLIRNKR
ncbi:Radical SAM domain protein [Syntrophobotulus glycolicus DSM 8271]|uniref:Radical SAM domain protein n=1 Tax=Syntrophobotulus glycolicus (strain DSM 8271 / FlGlyR) TaxID=645991 RepID=F0SZC9_SYNGF|nr:radical SAM protein [Syntrophobotulus glycolicus]ADY54934.1 Radical SAM domain protein [Syntrophobotulus glycolicus DSM 8271]